MEHFFACVRQMGRTHEHPNAVNFKHRMRMFLLARHTSLVSEKFNSASDHHDCLSSGCSGTVPESSERPFNCLTGTALVTVAFESAKEKDLSKSTLYLVNEAEGLAYLGGAITRKARPSASLTRYSVLLDKSFSLALSNATVTRA